MANWHPEICIDTAQTVVTGSPSLSRMERVYGAVSAAQKAAIMALVPNTPLSAVYEAAVAALRENVPDDVVSTLGKNVGFAMGLELREAKLQIAAGNDVKVLPGMVFNVSVGLSGLENPGAESPKDQCVAAPRCTTLLFVVFGGLWGASLWRRRACSTSNVRR
jgi:nucleosome binding factor SPN SPT16 subunit